MKRKRNFRIAAEWLADNDPGWWFFQKMREVNRGDAMISVIGNNRWYNEKDRNSLFGHILYVFKTFCFSIRICLKAKRGDVIFCWNQLPALIVSTFLRMTFSKKVIICQNFLYRNSGKKTGDLVRRTLYNFALNYKHLYVSLQSEPLFDNYKNNCGLDLVKDRVYFIGDCLPDDRMPPEFISTSRAAGEEYIFTGGEANRDWKLVMDIAAKLPQYRFRCVARKRFFDPELIIPGNVTMYWDTSRDEYFQLIGACKISFIPIRDELNPAGLLLLFDSALAGKAVLSSETPFLSAYFGKYRERLMFRNLNEAVDKMQHLYEANDLADINAELKRNIENLTPESYCTQHLNKFYELSEIN